MIRIDCARYDTGKSTVIVIDFFVLELWSGYKDVQTRTGWAKKVTPLSTRRYNAR